MSRTDRQEGQALVESYTLCGIEAWPVEVQVSVEGGYPTTSIVGLPDKAVQESMDRIWAAFHSSGYPRPDKHVTVNLAPAELRKEGSSFDLPIALGILAASRAFPPERLAGLPVAGELALNGEVRPIRGALAMALAAARAGRQRILLPRANLAEAVDVAGVTPLPMHSLAGTVADLIREEWDLGDDDGQPTPSPPATSEDRAADFSQVRGQRAAKRALEVAAAGGHNLLMSGPPGAGKSLLAQRLPTILPPLSADEVLEATLVHSAAGLLRVGSGRIRLRPFRAPHHTVSGPGLVGGGAYPRPGEISLAHCGVLFLDEMPEFRSSVLNLLRQPLEDGWVRIVRSGRVVTFPCRFMLVGAMNPCPCGFLGHPRKPCRCTPHQIKVYRGRLSGPLLDRVDLHIEVPAVSARDLMRKLGRGAREAPNRALDRTTSGHRPVPVASPVGLAADGTEEPSAGSLAAEGSEEASAIIRGRVVQARAIQTRRLARRAGIHCNAQMDLPDLEEFCRVDQPTRAFLQKAVESLSLSARAAHRSLRVARTIADLAGAPEILMEHVAEAVQYQGLDRGEDPD